MTVHGGQGMTAYGLLMTDVRAGSGQELCNLDQSAKPALLEANFQAAGSYSAVFGLGGSFWVREHSDF